MCLAYLIFLDLFTPSNVWRGLDTIKLLSMQFLLFASAFGPNATAIMFLHGVFPYSFVSLRHLKYFIFEFLCIISLYYIKNQQDVTLAVLFISQCKSTVHVSDAFCVHHQEY